MRGMEWNVSEAGGEYDGWKGELGEDGLGRWYPCSCGGRRWLEGEADAQIEAEIVVMVWGGGLGMRWGML